MDLSLASVLLAGFVVSIEPCALTVDLLIIGYITGAEDDDKVSTGWIRGFLAGLAFIAGRSITYAAMGVSAAFIGIHASSTVQAYSGMAAGIIMGPVLIVVGLLMLDVINLNMSAGHSMLRAARDRLVKHGILGALILGVIFGLAIYPCSTPILIALLTMVAVKADLVHGLVLMLAYGMALGAPIPFIASGAVGVKTYAEKTAHLGIWFKKVAGVLLVAFGLYYLLPWVGDIV
jgi:cytochrome c biogenesis protein CcdA